MLSVTYQPALRPALPCIFGPLDYREQRALFERIDVILSVSGLEQDSINLALTDQNITLILALTTSLALAQGDLNPPPRSPTATMKALDKILEHKIGKELRSPPLLHKER